MNGKQAKRIRRAIGFYPNKQRHYVEKFVFFKPHNVLSPNGILEKGGEYRTSTIMNPIRSVRFLYQMLKADFKRNHSRLSTA